MPEIGTSIQVFKKKFFLKILEFCFFNSCGTFNTVKYRYHIKCLKNAVLKKSINTLILLSTLLLSNTATIEWL